jgi:hypothetical protein
MMMEPDPTTLLNRIVELLEMLVNDQINQRYDDVSELSAEDILGPSLEDIDEGLTRPGWDYRNLKLRDWKKR